MSEPRIYAVERATDHVDRLYQIVSLAKVGAASTDTALNIDLNDGAHRSLFEVIHRLASEAVEIAESVPSVTIRDATSELS